MCSRRKRQERVEATRWIIERISARDIGVAPRIFLPTGPETNRKANKEVSWLRTWGPVAFWGVIIFLESEVGSAENTAEVLQTLVVWLFGQVDPTRFEVFHHFLRKAGHFLGYGVLGYLCFEALLRNLKSMRPVIVGTLASVCASFVAVLDEWHQSFMLDRTGQIPDVALDASGAIALVVVATLSAYRSRIG